MVTTDAFIPTVRETAKSVGYPEFPVAVVTHPIANLDDVELEQLAALAEDQVVTILIGGK